MAGHVAFDRVAAIQSYRQAIRNRDGASYEWTKDEYDIRARLLRAEWATRFGTDSLHFAALGQSADTQEYGRLPLSELDEFLDVIKLWQTSEGTERINQRSRATALVSAWQIACETYRNLFYSPAVSR